MAIGDTADLEKMLEPFPGEVQATALWLREFVWKLYPDSNELIYDAYSALAYGWGLSDRLGDVFCSIAVYKSINFGFNRGAELKDPERRLLGGGKIYRYLKVTDRETFPADYAKMLLDQAHANALSRFRQPEQTLTGATIVKAVYDKKRRPSK